MKRMRRSLRRWNKFKRNFLSAYPRGSNVSREIFGTAAGPNSPAIVNARRTFKYSGDGDYKDWLKWGVRGLGGVGGAMAGFYGGGLQGAMKGGAAGWNQGANISRYMGWGDYTTNQIVAGGKGSQISVNQGDLTGDIWVSRSEFVQNIVATGTAGTSTLFQINGFSLNPGLPGTFPWLSQIAQNFTLWDAKGLMFQYKPTFTESAGTSSSLGKVILCTQYDPDASAFISSVQMENYDYANSCKPSDGLIHGCETKNSQQFGNMLYVRTGSSSRDKIFTDIGTLFVATEGIPLAAGQTSCIVGELWVTYHVKLSRAELYGSMLGLNVLNDCIVGTTSAAALVVTSVPATDNNIGVTVTNGSATSMVITFPATISLGFFQISVFFNSGGTVFTTQTPTNFTAITNCQMFRPGVAGSVITPVGPAAASAGLFAPTTQTNCTSNSALMAQGFIVINAPGQSQASVTLNVSAALSATTIFEVLVTQINQTMSFTNV